MYAIYYYRRIMMYSIYVYILNLYKLNCSTEDIATNVYPDLFI